MKKISFLLIWLFWGNLYSQTPQISNNSFENWTTVVLKSLQDYFDSGDEGNDNNNIQQLTDAVSGQYSVKIESSIDNERDINPGYFINFDPDHDFSGGVPYAEHVDSICGYYKAHLIAQDTALLVAIFKNSGNLIGGGVYKFDAGKNTTNWTRFCYPTQMPQGVVPDSLMFGAASSNAIEEVGMEAGSWIQFDSIFFKSANQLTTPPPNHSFENWDERSIDFPDDFDTTLKWDTNTSPLSVEKTTDATDGNYAIKLNTVISQYQDTIIGAFTNGIIGDWPFSGGIAIGETPVEVSWDYKVHVAGFRDFDPRIAIVFKQNGQEIANIGQSYTQSVNTYQYTTLPINLNTTPDTLQVVAFSGGYPGNSLWVDNIVLTYTSGITENLNIKRSVAFPVPAQNYLNFKIEALKPENITIQIIDLNGRVIRKQSFELINGSNQIQMPIKNISKGQYLYRIQTQSGAITHAFIKN